jgi:hypothetical protein
MPIETPLLMGAVHVLLGIATVKFFQNLGIPALAPFLEAGKASGSGGLPAIASTSRARPDPSESGSRS